MTKKQAKKTAELSWLMSACHRGGKDLFYYPSAMVTNKCACPPSFLGRLGVYSALVISLKNNIVRQ